MRSLLSRQLQIWEVFSFLLLWSSGLLTYGPGTLSLRDGLNGVFLKMVSDILTSSSLAGWAEFLGAWPLSGSTRVKIRFPRVDPNPATLLKGQVWGHNRSGNNTMCKVKIRAGSWSACQGLSKSTQILACRILRLFCKQQKLEGHA